jgi:hypothetical protein
MKLKEKSQMLEYYVEEGISKIETTISQIENLRGTEITLRVTCLSIPRLPRKAQEEDKQCSMHKDKEFS